MTEWILSSSVLILIVIGLRYCLKGKISLRLQYALWGLVLVRLLLPFSVGSSEFSVMNWLPELRQETEQNSDILYSMEDAQGENTANGLNVVLSGNLSTDTKPSELQPDKMTEGSTAEQGTITSSTAEKTAMELSEILTIVWLTGMGCVALFLFFSNLTFSQRLKKSRQKMSGMTIALPVYLSDAVDTPCLFGLFRPAIYVTNEATENATSLHHILAHEMTHYRHGDHAWAILRGGCLALHWYNPLVWWAAVLSRADAELACDEATIKRLGDQERAEYGRTLISMTCQKRAALFVTATTMTGSKNGIKERITLIVKKPKMAVYTLIAVIVLATVAVGCTFTGDKKEANADNAEGIDSEVKVGERQFPDTTITPALTEMPINDPTPTAMLTPEPTVKPELVFDIQAELNTVETAYKELQEKLQTDPSLNQADMNTLAGECCTLWEEAMDTFWYMLEPMLTADEVMKLHTEQQEWLSKRDAEVQKIVEEYEGGSITGLLVGQKKAELTRERVYELADHLTKVAEQVINVAAKDYSGHYVDTQGTDVVYSELILTRQEDGSYQAEIGIYRLALFEGTAVQQGSLLLFEDPDMRVKGNIRISSGEAIFTVTESFFEYVTPGEGFEFTKSE